MQVSRTDRLRNQERLRALAQDATGEVAILCSHDAVILDRCRARQGACQAAAHGLSSPAMADLRSDLAT